ncbi:MAG: response regulator [Chloroflexi bacterium]|nr:response regulator [Chloroflexota bacterium]
MENHTTSTNQHARILVVDDHPTTASTLARAISQSWPKTEVISATSGKIALEQIKDGPVDLVITDMMMPEMNGLELIEKLQSHPAGRPAYTILITAYDVPGLKETARRLKVNETIIKPIRPEHICQSVGKMLEEMGKAQSPTKSMETQGIFKILIADDVPDNVSLLSRYLQREGYAFVTASNGVETLEKVRSQMPDLILLDVNMPEKDGFEVLKEIRSDPLIEHIPVIILTAARLDSANMQYGLNLGADDYVTKPFDPRELLARIRTKLRAKESEEIIRRRYKELSVLPEIGRELGARLDINELTEVVLRRSVETLGAVYGRILILNQKDRIQKTYGLVSSPAIGLQPPDMDEFIHQIDETRQGLIIPDVRNEPHWQAAESDPARSALITPLIGRFGLVGLLILAHEQTGYFKSDHLLLSQAIASQAAIAVENICLHARMVMEQQRSSAILQNAAEAILLFDSEGRLALINPAGEKLFTDYQTKIGQLLDQGNGYDGLIGSLEKAIKSGKPETVEITWPDRRSFSAQFTPIEGEGCVVILHDVTRFKDLKNITDEFISMASHNLKHPITVIAGFTQLLSQAGPLNQKQLEYVSQINIASQNMNVQVQNMLDLVRADMSKDTELKLENMDLSAVISEVMDEFQWQALAKEQRLQLQISKEHLVVQADPLQVRQVLRDLINNAMKYTPNGGAIQLSLDELDHAAMIKVSDTGYGIPSEDLSFIFDRFYRVRNSDTRGIEGNGLGLAIVKSIIERHGGQISVESKIGKGSCFTFTLPIKQPKFIEVSSFESNSMLGK